MEDDGSRRVKDRFVLRPPSSVYRYAHDHFSLLGELDGVAEQVYQNLA
jgi:hypothetical protein